MTGSPAASASATNCAATAWSQDIAAALAGESSALGGSQPVRAGARVLDAEGAEVGQVTSGGFGAALGLPIAMAYVAAAHAADGTPLQVDVRGKMLTATVSPMPFFPKSHVRQGAA